MRALDVTRHRRLHGGARRRRRARVAPPERPPTNTSSPTASIPGWAIGMSLLATIITSVTFIAYPGAAYAGDWSLLVPGIMFVAGHRRDRLRRRALLPPRRRHERVRVLRQALRPLRPHVLLLRLRHGPLLQDGLRLLPAGALGWRHHRLEPHARHRDSRLSSPSSTHSSADSRRSSGPTSCRDSSSGPASPSPSACCCSRRASIPAQMLHLIAANHKTSLGGFDFNLARADILDHGDLRILLLPAEVHGRSDRGAALSRRQDRPLRPARHRHGRHALPARVDGVHVHRQPAVGVLSHSPANTFPPPSPSPTRFSPLHGHADAGRRCRALSRRALRRGHVHARLRSQLPGRHPRRRFLWPLCARSHSTRSDLRVGKLSVAVCGVLAIAGALRLSTTQGSALALYYLLTAIVAGGLAGLFLLAFLVPRAGRAAALIAIAVNLLFTAWATLTMNGGHTWNLHRWNYPWHEFTIGAVGNTLMFLVGCIASIVVPADRTYRPHAMGLAGDGQQIWPASRLRRQR